jgi:hypothetical protein
MTALIAFYFVLQTSLFGSDTATQSTDTTSTQTQAIGWDDND